MVDEDECFLTIPWLVAIAGFENDIPKERMPFIRTKHMNNKTDGCFICGGMGFITRHHIRKGHNPLAVYLCRKHHDIIHGIALNKIHEKGRRKDKYVYKDADLRTMLTMAKTYRLFKSGERGIVIKRIENELMRRDAEQERRERDRE